MRPGPVLWIPALLAITLIVYFPVLFNGFFCWDDRDVALSPLVRSLDAIPIRNFFLSFHAGLYHPLTTLSFALDFSAGKGGAFFYHLTNLVLHLVNTLLVFLLLRRITGNQFVAVVASFLFALSPMNVETVAWITSRKDLLYGFFFLASMISYREFSRRQEKRRVMYIVTILLVICSCLSKVQAVVLPFVFLLMDYLAEKKVFTARNLVQKIPFLIPAIFFLAINFYAQKDAGLFGTRMSYSIMERFILACYGFSQYFLRILVPLQVSVFYPYPFGPGQPFSAWYLFPVLFFLLFLFFGIWMIRKHKRDYVFGYLFFFICISIVIGAGHFREFIIAGRYTYIASLGLFLFLAVFLNDVRKRFPRTKIWITLFFTGFILALGMISFGQNRLWHSPFRVIESASKQFPATPVLLNTLASIETDSARYPQAIHYAGMAAGLDRNYAQAYYTRGIAEDRMGETDQAVIDFTRAIRINPQYYDAWFGRGNVFRRIEDYRDALYDYSMVISLRSDHSGAWNNRAIVKGNLGDFRGALEDLDQAIRYNPGSGPSWYLRGIAKFECGLNGCEDLNKAMSLGYSSAQKALDHYCR